MTPKRARTRAALIQATLEILLRDGFHGLAVATVAKHAGVTTGAVYDNFPSKDAMIAAAMTSIPRRQGSAFVWPTGHDGTVRARLRRLGEAVLLGGQAGFSAVHAEFLLYAISHEELRNQLNALDVFAPLGGEPEVLGLFAPEELPIPPAAFALMLNAMVPGLMYGRFFTPRQYTDDMILLIFEGLAGSAGGSH